MRVLVPSAPLRLLWDPNTNQLSFEPPEQDGGSRIQLYEVHVMHQGTWYLLVCIEVKYLSSVPVIPENIFGRLSGQYCLRVYSRNLAGVGDYSETLVNLTGDIPFHPKSVNELSEDHFVQKNRTWLAEFFFISDHGDAPKTWKTVKKCKQIAISDLRERFARDFRRCITVTDTGGENNGSTVSAAIMLILNNLNILIQALCCYSFSEQDLSLESVWSPTAAHHSGNIMTVIP